MRVDLSLDHFVFQADQTSVRTITTDTTLLTRRGITAGERDAMNFYPKTQSLEVVEAWVDQPDGTRVPVAPGSIFTRPSAASRSAPGFTDSQTTTVLFPQLREGSRTHIVWRKTQRTPPLLGVQIVDHPPVEWAVDNQIVEIDAPEAMPLHWVTRGEYRVEQRVEDGVRHLRARISDLPGQEPERNSVSATDFQPLFLATSLPDLREIGAIYHRQQQDRAVTTPEIEALAHHIAGDRTGLDAARAVYDWVAVNIRYVAVYLDENDGWVPHAASEVLARGYGDCKDHVVLMQALLQALGVRAEAAIIDWGNAFAPMPLWVSQFNHAIVYLPEYDRYLNPTNPYAPFDAVDPRLSGKLVVIATDQGRVSRTPDMRPQDAQYRLSATAQVLPDGTIEGRARITMSAYPQAGIRGAVSEASSNADLAEQLLRATTEGGFGDLTTTPPRDLAQPFEIEATWRSPHGVAQCCAAASLPVPTGIDLARPSNLRQYLSRDGKRTTPLVIGAKDQEWQTAITLPSGIAAASLPPNVALHNDAGSYSATYTPQPGGVRVTRHLVLARTVYRPAEIAAFEALIYAALDDSRAALRLEGAGG